MKLNRSISRKSAAVLLGLSAMILVNACSKSDKVSAAETAKTETMIVGPENIAIAANGSIMTGPSISGTLEPDREAVLRAQVTGSVLQTYADQGQAVNAGTVLARIDASGIQDAYNSARAGLVSARNAADVAAKDLARNEKLLAAGAIAERDIDQSRRASIAAQAALEDANSRLATAEKAYRSTTVTAPFSGVVSERPVSAGDVVQPGTALFTVVDPEARGIGTGRAAIVDSRRCARRLHRQRLSRPPICRTYHPHQSDGRPDDAPGSHLRVDPECR